MVAGGVTANARVNADGPMDALKVTIEGDSPAVAGQPARINTTTTVNLTAKELQLASLKATLARPGSEPSESCQDCRSPTV